MNTVTRLIVIPAKAGIQGFPAKPKADALGPRLRGGDDMGAHEA